MLMGNLVTKERSKYTKTKPDRVCAGAAQYAIETQREKYSREMVDAVRNFRNRIPLTERHVPLSDQRFGVGRLFLILFEKHHPSTIGGVES